MKFAPIALFVYKRPEHTRKTIESLMRCPEFSQSQLYVFSDAAKSPEDEIPVQQVRDLIHRLLGQKAKTIFAKQNCGLAKSIISGVTYLCNEYDRVIVVEDDLEVSPVFLTFINAALCKYENVASVMQVNGYMFPIAELEGSHSAVFLPFISSWGWGTWNRAWRHFDPDAKGWEILNTDESLRYDFNLQGTYRYYEMLKAQMACEIDSWAVRWYWSVFKQKGYAVFPPTSYVSNIGIDGTGTHGSRFARKVLRPVKFSNQITMPMLPDKVESDDVTFKLVRSFLRKLSPLWVFYVKKFLKHLLKLTRRLYHVNKSLPASKL
jgi:hypothetical protein